MSTIKVGCGNSNKYNLRESVHLVSGEAEGVSKLAEGIRPRNRLSCLPGAEIMLII